MNATFKPPVLGDIHGLPATSISALKANPAAVVAASCEKPVAILNRNRAVAYVVSPEFIEMAYQALEDLLDLEIVQERRKEKAKAIRVTFADLRD